MVNETVTIDTLSTVNDIYLISKLGQDKTILDITAQVATILIAIVNAFLVFYIYKRNKRKDDNDKAKERRLSLLKTLVFDNNMKEFYLFFNKIKEKTNGLKEIDLNDDQKSVINNDIAELASDFRQDFIDLFIAIDKTNLYDRILEETDLLTDDLTNKIFDGGINLTHEPRFEEEISKKIRESKTGMIKILFSYS